MGLRAPYGVSGTKYRSAISEARAFPPGAGPNHCLSFVKRLLAFLAKHFLKSLGPGFPFSGFSQCSEDSRAECATTRVTCARLHAACWAPSSCAGSWCLSASLRVDVASVFAQLSPPLGTHRQGLGIGVLPLACVSLLATFLFLPQNFGSFRVCVGKVRTFPEGSWERRLRAHLHGVDPQAPPGVTPKHRGDPSTPRCTPKSRPHHPQSKLPEELVVPAQE